MKLYSFQFKGQVPANPLHFSVHTEIKFNMRVANRRTESDTCGGEMKGRAGDLVDDSAARNDLSRLWIKDARHAKWYRSVDEGIALLILLNRKCYAQG